jgi:hypothetical protein
MEERRRRIRFRERNEVLVRTALNRYRGTGIKGHTHDLSTGGTRIFIRKAYPVGSKVRLRIDLARTKQSVTLDGVVKWVRAAEDEALFEVGVGFQNLTSHTILLLIKHLYCDIVRAPGRPFESEVLPDRPLT